MATTAFWKKELALGTALVGFGLLVLPLAVYWVGRQVIGEYSADAGPMDLLSHIWSDLGRGGVLAWILALGPYVVVQLLRASRALWRRSRSVNHVTVSDDYQ